MHWTTRELQESGLSRRGIQRRLAEGSLYRLSRGIYTATRPDPKDALRAIQHRFPKLIFTGATAAGVYGLGPVSAPAQGIVPHGYRSIRTATVQAFPSRRRAFRQVEKIRVDIPVAAELHGRHDFWELVRFLETSYSGFKGSALFETDLRCLSPVIGVTRRRYRAGRRKVSGSFTRNSSPRRS